MRLRGLLGAGALAALLAAGGAAASGCSVLNDAATSATAPLAALPATDAVAELNVQTDVSYLHTTGGVGGVGGLSSGGGGIGFVNGPSSGPSETSFAQPSPGVSVVAVWNDITRDCLGAAVLSGTAAAPVLGRTAAGTYWFVQRATPSVDCNASIFAREAAVPNGWPAGDPSSSGFPAA